MSISEIIGWTTEIKYVMVDKEGQLWYRTIANTKMESKNLIQESFKNDFTCHPVNSDYKLLD